MKYLDLISSVLPLLQLIVITSVSAPLSEKVKCRARACAGSETG
jgi:hypothetical protein